MISYLKSLLQSDEPLWYRILMLGLGLILASLALGLLSMMAVYWLRAC
jgi:hypothetical protein